MSNELLTELVKAIFTIIGILITAYVVPWLKEKVGEQRYDYMLDFCFKAVGAAEKIYTSEQWMMKKEYVFNLVKERAAHVGLNITDDELNAVVEGVVFSVKGGEK